MKTHSLHTDIRKTNHLRPTALVLAVTLPLACEAPVQRPILAAAPLPQIAHSGLPAGYDFDLRLGSGETAENYQVTKVEEEERVQTIEYYEKCEEVLGAFPVSTFSCEDAQLMPTTGVLNPGPSIPRPDAEPLPPKLEDISSCDRPSLIYRDLKNIGCVSGNRIKRLSTKTSDWVYVCRKGHEFFNDEHLYSEIGLIGYNRETGATCFFAGRPAATVKITSRGSDGTSRSAVLSALVGRELHAPTSEKGVPHWGVPMGTGCVTCHSHGPWLNFPFVDGKNSYAEFTWVDEKGEPQIKDLDPGGYVESDGAPVVPRRHPGMLYDPVYPQDVLQEMPGAAWTRAYRLSPQVSDAAICTTCHHIGNATYSDRYPRSVFHFNDARKLHTEDDVLKLHTEDGGLKLHTEDGGLDRANLYKANQSVGLRGSHNSKMLTLAWAQPATAGIPGFVFETPDGQRVNPVKVEDIHRPNVAISKALAAIANCSDETADCWKDHFTVASVREDPLSYLKDTCSSCHSPENEKLADIPKLVTKDDFLSGGDAWHRLNDSEKPHPPGGQLQPSVLKHLKPFFDSTTP